MDCFVGIDLGSTTTKAVVLDTAGQIIGRGITNSRSNYDVAAQVAKQEAYTSARFALLSRELNARENITKEDREMLEAALLAAYRHELFLGSLNRLENHCREDLENLRFANTRRELSQALEVILQGIRETADSIFVPESVARSDFFRDIAGSAFIEAASDITRNGGPAFDSMVGMFDRNIIPVENETETRGFEDLLMAAYHRLPKGLLEKDAELAELLKRIATLELNELRTVGTGYGRVRLPFPRDCIRSEILCHGLGAHLMFPATATVLDIGGQDTKAIQVDPQGVVTSFQMNDRCAAGCGRYLGYIADEMNIGLHELGPLAMASKRRVKINSTCTVFAGAEFRDRLAAGQERVDIVNGLHRAIILRAMSLLARSGGITNEFTFTGGVAKNPAAVRALREVAEENYGKLILNIAPDSIYTGAVGAGTFAMRDIVQGIKPGQEAA
ncbi:MAG: benzoyl-CoA reductase subunit A [Planctomycetes bacterium]|nr:benzoyl-CoA reductase subunit A [Planctomycetota bacterium]